MNCPRKSQRVTSRDVLCFSVFPCIAIVRSSKVQYYKGIGIDLKCNSHGTIRTIKNKESVSEGRKNDF